VLIVDVEAGKPASVESVALSSGTRLIQLAGTLEQVLTMAEEVEGAYVKVMLDEPGRAGLNDEVRAAIPGVVEVNIARPDDTEPRERVRRAGRTPIELFETYLAANRVDDPAVVALFRELEQEVVSS
jgi:hypothetical protein